jgi:hypothetical protein
MQEGSGHLSGKLKAFLADPDGIDPSAEGVKGLGDLAFRCGVQRT